MPLSNSQNKDVCVFSQSYSRAFRVQGMKMIAYACNCMNDDAADKDGDYDKKDAVDDEENDDID